MACLKPCMTMSSRKCDCSHLFKPLDADNRLAISHGLYPEELKLSFYSRHQVGISVRRDCEWQPDGMSLHGYVYSEQERCACCHIDCAILLEHGERSNRSHASDINNC